MVVLIMDYDFNVYDNYLVLLMTIICSSEHRRIYCNVSSSRTKQELYTIGKTSVNPNLIRIKTDVQKFQLI